MPGGSRSADRTNHATDDRAKGKSETDKINKRQDRPGCRAAQTADSVTRSILIVFMGEVYPATTVTSHFRTLRRFARKLINISLALPLSGGAATAILARPSHSPNRRVREAPGTTFTGSRTAFPSVVMFSMSILYTS